MQRKITILAGYVAAMMAAAGARADVPQVTVDIAPVQSLAARVMAGLGEPALVVRPGASPHGFSMRPSEAAALQRAEVVFFVSGRLTPWFEEALEPLAGKAQIVELLEAEGSVRHNFRDAVVFGEDGHDHEHEEGEAHGDEHEEGHDEDHAHEDEQAHAGESDHDDDHGHAHVGVDPHGWLDPENGKVWLGVMAETLAEKDPDNAAAYRANAVAGQAEIDAAVAKAEALLAPVRDRAFVAQHDAYQYFEHRFGLQVAGAISLGDAVQPGPRRIAELREALKARDVVCVFSEPQFNPGLIATVFDGSDVRVAELDPLGTGLPRGAALYPALIERVAKDVASCLGE